jgi:GAF domain-containing protein
MTVDGQLVARTVAELRAMPQAEDLLARLGRVVEVTRTVVGVDGTGLTLVHDDGPPRWVATTDAAMQLLEEVQHDFGEGPCLAAFAEDRVVAVQDLRTELVWDRIAVVVRQLQVRGVLSVPVRLADQPVGTLNVYATQPRAWSPAEVQALGAFAVVTAELVRTAVELANHQLEVAQLRQALASRVWIEQAKGMVAATEGVTLDEASSSCGCGRGRLRASWLMSPKRSSKRCSGRGSRPRPWMTLGCGRPRRAPGRPSKTCRRPRPGWPGARPPRTGPRTTWPRESGRRPARAARRGTRPGR